MLTGDKTLPTVGLMLCRAVTVSFKRLLKCALQGCDNNLQKALTLCCAGLWHYIVQGNDSMLERAATICGARL